MNAREKKAVNRFQSLNAGAVCLNFNLRRSSRAVTAYYDSALKATGIKITQFSVLMAIAASEGATITDVARLAEVDRTTLTRSLRILEADQLVENEKASGGNLRKLRITNKGTAKMQKVYPVWFRAQRKLSRALSPVKTRSLRRLLTDLRAAADVSLPSSDGLKV